MIDDYSAIIPKFGNTTQFLHSIKLKYIDIIYIYI